MSATARPTLELPSRSLRTRTEMKKRVYTGLVVFAVLLLALGRLIVRPPRVVRELFMVPGRPRAQRAGAATGAGSL